MTEETLFHDARQKPHGERTAFLEEACAGNLALRERIEILLRADDHPESFLEPKLPATTPSPSVTERPGTVIGPYKLLEQIGEGGFGVVFLAEQTEPVRRRVALKIIKPGMDTRQVIARFEAERQALAMMDHPNIAKVLDAGTTADPQARVGEGETRRGGEPDDQASHRISPSPSLPLSPAGRPYFVMELVQGVPITEYCDQCNLTTRERLELFITVCQAVQHAHQKGVIHRDIKPTNVLVAMQDGRPAPKIIDFGVAKAMGQRLTEHTLTTAFSQMVGSPLYMSPEQAELSPLGVDTRSDIYSLGVLLYELLTGTTPFGKDRLHAASYDELRRIIREEEPPRPSARLSQIARPSSDSLPLAGRVGEGVSATETAALATTIAEHRRTDPRRLLQTVRGELDWIVMKCLEKDRSRRYETANGLANDLQRYLADEPVQACPPSASYRLKKFIRRNKAAVAFVALLLASLVGLVISNIAIKRERDAKAMALTDANAVSSLLQELLASSNPDQLKGANYTVREQLDDFSESLDDQLADKPEVEAPIRSVIGKSYWRLGATDRAEPHLKRALDLNRQVYGAGDERTANSLVDYAWNLLDVGKSHLAQAAAAKAGERYAEAETYVREAIAIYRKNSSDPRTLMRGLFCLQDCLLRQRRRAESAEVAKEALSLASGRDEADFPELPNVLHDLADAKSLDGEHQLAESLARRAVELHRRLHGDEHHETACGLWVLGEALLGQKKYADAEIPLREALTIFNKYYTPDNRHVRGVSQDLAAVLRAMGDHAGAEVIERQMGADNPTEQNGGAGGNSNNDQTPTKDNE